MKRWMVAGLLLVGVGSVNAQEGPVPDRTLTDNVRTVFVAISAPPDLITSGRITYTVWALDATATQAKSGQLWYRVENDAGTEICSVHVDRRQAVRKAEAFSQGALTATFFCDTTPTNGIHISVEVDSSLMPTAMGIRYRVYPNPADAVWPHD